jgi:electron-transferring-flavoprotein dehydrogenase
MGQKRDPHFNRRDVEREELEVDVLVLGAGPAGLACALALQRELAATPLAGASVLVLEKAEEVGYHTLSGAVMDPRGIAALFPDWKERGCPVEAPVGFDCLDVLRANGKRWRIAGALMPPPLRNHGNYVVSLYKVVRWLKDQAEAAGIDVYPGFAGAEILWDGTRVAGVQTRDAGLDRRGAKKGTFQPGMNVRAKVTVFAEGTRGSLAKELVMRLGLDRGQNPQIYETGVKEIWELPEERGRALTGQVIHTLGQPLGLGARAAYGGGWIYGQGQNRLSLGFVVGLDHGDARLDPHALFVEWKRHPRVAELLRGAKLVRYGAKTIPGGGYFAMPRREFDGGVLIGDSAGFVNMARLKGIHLAIESGLLAAGGIAEALASGDTSAAGLAGYTRRFEASPAKAELWGTRNFRAAFQAGFWSGVLDAGVQQITKGRGLFVRRRSHRDHEAMRPARAARLAKPPFDRGDRGDGGIALDKLTDVYHSGAVHEEDQVPHLVVTDPELCAARCTQEFGNPCQHFCPAAVYEWPPGRESAAGGGPLINASNCVHCKTCDVADPYQIIEWVVPEGGGGPKYIDM